MAAGAWTLYSNAVLGITKKLMDLSADTYVLILVTNSYNPAVNTDTTYVNVSATELTTGGGYTVGGVALASVADTLTGGLVTFTSANPSWPSFTAGPFRYGVIVHRAGGSLISGDLLLCYSDLGGGSSITGTNTTLTVTMSGSGIFTIGHSP